ALTASLAVALGAHWTRPSESNEDALIRHLDSARSSVYLLGAQTATGFVPIGTGWSVADKTLATNAHVIDALQERRDRGETVAARMPGSPPVDITLVRLEKPPAYDRLDPLMSACFATPTGAPGHALPGFDVALIHTDAEVARPLALASDEEVRHLKA